MFISVSCTDTVSIQTLFIERSRNCSKQEMHLWITIEPLSKSASMNTVNVCPSLG